MTIEVTHAAVETMLAEAALAGEQEACGLLFGAAGRIEAAQPARNVALEPERHFEIDPQALIDAQRAERANGPPLAGYYHSHPNGRLEPSATDRERASGDGRVWAIIANGQARFWRDTVDGFEPLSYLLVAE